MPKTNQEKDKSLSLSFKKPEVEMLSFYVISYQTDSLGRFRHTLDQHDPDVFSVLKHLTQPSDLVRS